MDGLREPVCARQAAKRSSSPLSGTTSAALSKLASSIVWMLLARICLARRSFRHGSASNALCMHLWNLGAGGVEPLVVRANETLQALDRAGSIGILTPEIDALLAVARGVGVPARVSGAGGGDGVVGLAATARDAERLARAWTDSGFAAHRACKTERPQRE